MRHLRLSILTCVLLAASFLPACLTGGASTGFAPGAPSAIPSAGTISPSPTGGIFMGDAGTTLPPGGAATAAGGEDTMPPRSDSGDCMNYHLDGTVYCGPEIREACRVSYVPAPKIKVMAGTGSPLPPIPLEGKTSFNGRFYAETGSAPLSCEDASCWTWEPIGFGDAFLMRLSRLQPSAPLLQFHEDMIAEFTGEDGANLTVPATPIKNGDEIEFYATLSDTRFDGYSETLAPLTDEVWTKAGIKCELGGFQIDTGTTYEKRTDGVSTPGLDGILLDRSTLKK